MLILREETESVTSGKKTCPKFQRQCLRLGSCYFISDGQGRAGLEVIFELRRGRPPPGGYLGLKFAWHRGQNYKGPQNRKITWHIEEQ